MTQENPITEPPRKEGRLPGWLRADAAVIVALAALIASLAVSYGQCRQTANERDHDLRTELRSHLERLSALQLEIAEQRVTCAPENPDCYGIALVLRDEQAVTARQAAEIADAISDDITSAEYRAVAVALSSARETELAMEFLDKASKSATSPQDIVNAAVLRGNVLRTEGDYDAARDVYDDARDAVEDYDFQFESDGKMLLFTIESNWVDTEVADGECDEAVEHGEAAMALLEEVGPELLLVDPVQFEAVLEAEVDRCRSSG